MKIQEIKVTDLKPYPKNAKIHPQEQIEKIANSIQEFGFKQPLVIDKDNIVIVGHGRLEGAKKLGLETVPCLIAEDLNENQIKAYRLADNKLNESNWDNKLLIEEIEFLQNEKFNIENIGIITNFEITNSSKEIDFNEIENDLKNQCPKCKFRF